jgi:hypothetical protein
MINLFIKRVLIFLLPLAILAYLIDPLLSSSLSNHESPSISAGEYAVWNDIYEKNIDAEVAVYGSSRAWVQFNTIMLSDSLDTKTYNFGIDGHNFQLQYLRHIEYLRLNKKPNVIIISVDFATLQKRKDLYNYSQFLPYMLWNDNIYEYTKDYDGFNIADYNIPLLRFAGEFSTMTKAFFSTDDEKRVLGHVGRNLKWNKDFEVAQSQKKKIEVKTDSSTIVLFDRFLKTCKANDILVIMVYAPVYKYGFEYIANHQHVVDTFKLIAEDHKLPYLDYTKDSICYNQSLFYNATHLNKKGADAFTTQLYNDMKDLKLLSK